MPPARRSAWPFVAGVVAGAAAAASLLAGRGRRKRLHPRIIRALPRAGDPPLVVFVPGLCGSQLLRPDGSYIQLLQTGNEEPVEAQTMLLNELQA